MQAKTLQDIKDQLIKHWPTNVKDHYWIGLVTLYKVFPPTNKSGNRWPAKTKVPDDWLTPLERRTLFYKITNLDMKSREDNLKQKHKRKVKAIEFVEKYKENNIIAPEYTWRFSFAFNKF